MQKRQLEQLEFLNVDGFPETEKTDDAAITTGLTGSAADGAVGAERRRWYKR